MPKYILFLIGVSGRGGGWASSSAAWAVVARFVSEEGHTPAYASVSAYIKYIAPQIISIYILLVYNMIHNVTAQCNMIRLDNTR